MADITIDKLTAHTINSNPGSYEIMVRCNGATRKTSMAGRYFVPHWDPDAAKPRILRTDRATGAPRWANAALVHESTDNLQLDTQITMSSFTNSTRSFKDYCEIAFVLGTGTERYLSPWTSLDLVINEIDGERSRSTRWSANNRKLLISTHNGAGLCSVPSITTLRFDSNFPANVYGVLVR